MAKRETLVVTMVLSALIALVSFQTIRANKPNQPTSGGSSIFEKDKLVVLYAEVGLGRQWILCTVLDAKENWVKCDGGVVENGTIKIVEPYKGTWINVDHVLRVHTK